MSDSETWTIGKLLEWTKDYLTKHGSESPRLDAEVLLAHAKGCQRIELYTAFDQVATDEVRDKFRDLVKRRADGTPVAYLVGNREFYSLSFEVNPSVLIPRPETEFLVVRLLDLAKEAGTTSSNLNIVDVGTGSGIVAICAAKYLPQAKVVAIDISEDALSVAKRNAERHDVADRIEFRQGNLLDGVTEPVDFIVSNPPYVSEAEYADLSPQVLQEPKQALLAGQSGAELIEALISDSKNRLSVGGWLLIELSPMIVVRVQEYAASQPFLANIQITNDMAKLPRIVEMQRVE